MGTSTFKLKDMEYDPSTMRLEILPPPAPQEAREMFSKVVNPSELQEALATQRLVWEKVDVIVEKTKGFKDKEPFEDLGRLRELNIMTSTREHYSRLIQLATMKERNVYLEKLNKITALLRKEKSNPKSSLTSRAVQDLSKILNE